MKKIIFIILFIIFSAGPLISFAEEDKNTNNIKTTASNFIEKLPFKDKLNNYFLKSERFREKQLFFFLSQKDKAQNEIFIFEERINNQNLEENKKEIKNAVIYLKYYYFAFLAFILGNIFVYYILILVIVFYIIYKIWNRFRS